MQNLFVGGVILQNNIQTHGSREGGHYACIGTGPDCCHGSSIVPQHMDKAEKPPVKMLIFWMVIVVVCLGNYWKHLFVAGGHQCHVVHKNDLDGISDTFDAGTKS